MRSTELDQSVVLATLLLQAPLQPRSSSDPGGSETLNVKSTFMVSSHKGTPLRLRSCHPLSYPP